jgi:hypothetical protein
MTLKHQLTSAISCLALGSLTLVSTASADTIVSDTLPTFYEGKSIVQADQSKVVRIQLNSDEFLELQIPQLAYQNSRETKIQETDISRLSAIFVTLKEISQMPEGEQIQPFYVKLRADTLKSLADITEEFKERIDVYEISTTPDPTTAP